MIRKRLSDYIYTRKHPSLKEYWSYMLMLVVVLAIQTMRVLSLGIIDSNLDLGIMTWQIRIWAKENRKGRERTNDPRG